MTKFTSRLLFSLVFLLGTAGTLLAQTPQIYKSSGAQGNNSTFLLGSTGYARKTQMLFPAGTLTGATAGNITRIYFRYGTTGIANGQTLTNFTVRLGQAPVPGFIPASTGYNFFPGLDTVLTEASYSIPTGNSGDWFGIDLTTPFAFDPTFSLVLETAFDTSSSGNFGTLGGSNVPVHKIVTPDRASLTGSGTSSTWQDFGFDLAGTTGAPGLLSAPGLAIFPSPATDKLWIRPAGKLSGPAQLTVVNAVGEVVRQAVMAREEAENGYQLAVAAFPPGLYLVTLSTSQGIQRGSVTIVR